jgi:hypothetical protein
MKTLQTSTLRPGLLVSLKTSVRGNVSYEKRVLERERVTKDGKQLAKWETERVVANHEENERAQEARANANKAIRKVCAWSAFGLLCPENKADKLDEAVREARRIVEEFNATAEITRISVHVIAGRIAADDVEAVKAINGEIRELMDDMKEGLKNLDVKTIREAANKATQLGTMLSEDAAERVKVAIEAARKSAREIVKAGEQAAMEVDTAAIRRVDMARTTFLDFDEAKDVTAPKAETRALDLAPVSETKKTRAKARQLEIE